MRWERARRSENVVRAGGGRGLRVGGGLGLGGIAVVVVLSLMLGEDPLQVLSQIQGGSQGVSTQDTTVGEGDDQEVQFVRAVLGDTEDTWDALFATEGASYRQPTLALFEKGVQSACGFASSAVGPFYCPADQRVYLDLAFFRELEQRFAAAGDFAQAYVIAHEVGHHVQNLIGIPQQVAAARSRGTPMDGPNGLSVRQELQADCFAGVWAYNAQQRLDWMEPGDLEEALNAATAIGDDRLQQQSQGRVVPDSFTHGTSAQRVEWFRKGFDSGSPEACDTFRVKRITATQG